MKLLLTIVCLSFLFVSCSKDEPPQKNLVSTNTEAVAVAPVVAADPWIKASFYSTELKTVFTVRFTVFVNDNNSNGYVIIKDFTVGDKSYTVDLSRAEDYVAAIHNDSFTVNGKAIRSSKRECELFRTAEALCVAWGESGKADSVKEEDVAKYGKEMLGRQYGLPARFKLSK